MKGVLESRTWSLSDFVIKKRLGRGRASEIFLAIHVGTGMEVVLKKCRIDDPHEREQVQNEIKIHSVIEHPRVICFYGYFYDYDGVIYLILEHAKCGDVWEMITDSQPTEEEFRDRIMRPIVCALVHVHSLGIVHRDIKPENIFLSEKRNGVKLGDFGFATDEKTLKIHRLGTKGYMAPEILSCNLVKREKAISENRNLYDNKVDCWAIGVLAYEGLVGSTPWDTDGTIEEHLQHIITNPFIEHTGISKDVNDFIHRCLQILPEKRISTIEMLTHPWIQRSTRAPLVKSSSIQNGLSSNDRISVGNLRANTFQNGTSLYRYRKKEMGCTVNGTSIAQITDFMDVTVKGTTFSQTDREIEDDTTEFENKERTFKGCLPNIFSRKNRLKK